MEAETWVRQELQLHAGGQKRRVWKFRSENHEIVRSTLLGFPRNESDPSSVCHYLRISFGKEMKAFDEHKHRRIPCTAGLSSWETFVKIWNSLWLVRRFLRLFTLHGKSFISSTYIPELVPQIEHVRSFSELVLQPHASQVQRREEAPALFDLSMLSLSYRRHSKLSNEQMSIDAIASLGGV